MVHVCSIIFLCACTYRKLTIGERQRGGRKKWTSARAAGFFFYSCCVLEVNELRVEILITILWLRQCAVSMAEIQHFRALTFSITIFFFLPKIHLFSCRTMSGACATAHTLSRWSNNYRITWLLLTSTEESQMFVLFDPEFFTKISCLFQTINPIINISIQIWIFRTKSDKFTWNIFCLLIFSLICSMFLSWNFVFSLSIFVFIVCKMVLKFQKSQKCNFNLKLPVFHLFSGTFFLIK